MLNNPFQSINTFLSQVGAEQGFSFQVDIKPDESWNPVATYKFRDGEIPLFNQMTAAELMYMGIIDKQVNASKIEVGADLKALMYLIKQEFQTGDRQHTFNILKMVVSGDVQEASAEVTPETKTTAIAVISPLEKQVFEFGQTHKELINRYLIAQNKVYSEDVAQVFRVTLFLKQRFRADWDFGNTIGLFKDEINEILDLIELEANEGKPKAVIDDTLIEGEIEEDSPKRKGRRGAKPTGKESTPNLQAVS